MNVWTAVVIIVISVSGLLGYVAGRWWAGHRVRQRPE